MANARTTSQGGLGQRSASTSVIGRGVRIRGRVTGDGDVTVAGQIEGEMAVRGTLTIAEGGEVISNVDAEDVTVFGTLEGEVQAQGDVRIAAGSKVRGSIHSRSIALEEGAQFAGRLDGNFELPAELRDPKRR